MKIKILLLGFIGTVLPVILPAQTVPTAGAVPDLAALQAMQKSHADLVDRIAKGRIDAASALSQLQAQAPVAGAAIDRDLHFGQSALDVGRRLIASGKTGEAELFFRAAETTLSRAVAALPDSQPENKAQYLQNLAQLRGHYLNQPVQALADIEQAIALQPGDKYLQTLRDNLAREHSEISRTPTKS